MSDNPIARAQELRDKAFVIDVETTGLSAEDEVIELSIVRARNGHVLFNNRFKPSKRIEVGAFRVHGIRDSELFRCKSFVFHYEAISRVLQGETVAAWAASNDRRFLSQTFRKYELLEPQVNWICAMRLHQEFAGMPKPSKLGDACRQLGVKAGNHSAMSDALATARVIYKIALAGEQEPQAPVLPGQSQPEEEWYFEPPPPGKFTEFNLPPQGVTAAEFRANLRSELWTPLTDEELEAVESLIARAGPQLSDLRFDQYGPRVSMRLDDQLYFDLLAFRRLRFNRLNQKRTRKESVIEAQ